MALAREIGPRVAGEEGAELAAEYIAEQFDSYGYEVHRQLFEYTKFVDHGSKVELLPDGASLDGIPMEYSPAGEVEGRMIRAGLGRPRTYRMGDSRAGLPSSAAAAGSDSATKPWRRPRPVRAR